MALLAQGESVPRRGVTKRDCGALGGAASRRAAFEDAAERRRCRASAAGLGLDEIDVPGAGDAELGDDLAEAGLQTVAPEGRQGREALEDDHVRGFPWNTSGLL